MSSLELEPSLFERQSSQKCDEDGINNDRQRLSFDGTHEDARNLAYL